MDPLELLGRLAGRWIGRGTGQYPTIPAFEYHEETTFLLASEYPLLRFEQRTWLLPDRKPSHWEVGICLVTAAGDLQLSTAQDSGRVEVLCGRPEPLDEGGIRCVLKGKYLGNDPRLVSTERIITVHGDRLNYTKFMATTTTPAPSRLKHLEAGLNRTGP